MVFGGLFGGGGKKKGKKKAFSAFIDKNVLLLSRQTLYQEEDADTVQSIKLICSILFILVHKFSLKCFTNFICLYFIPLIYSIYLFDSFAVECLFLERRDIYLANCKTHLTWQSVNVWTSQMR